MLSPGVSQRPNTRSHARATTAAEHHTTAGFGWPRSTPTDAASARSETMMPQWSRRRETNDDNDESMEEYVASMLENAIAPTAPKSRGRVSGVPGPTQGGPRTRSASVGTPRPGAGVQAQKEDQHAASLTQTLSEQPVWGKEAISRELRAMAPGLAQWGVLD